MTTIARTFQTVRTHIPQIKFPNRIPGHASSVGSTMVQQQTPSSPPTPATPPVAKPIGSTARGSGMDYLNLPQKYHRQALSQEEIEYIERGGPE